MCFQVAAEWNLTQLCEALTRYRERESFLQESLICLYKHLNDTDIGCRPDILKVQGMLLYSVSVIFVLPTIWFDLNIYVMLMSFHQRFS